ncbi:MAG: MBL fold metallo-hydrolase [Candidatus Thorarchaeota archaeon]|nr:MBL fold metallo-hydrolase [Candidatus Thorarchaeota archaeon]
MTSEILPDVYRIEGDYTGEYGYLSAYLLANEDECLIVDPGTAGSPGEKILTAIKNIGLQPSKDVKAILCTHAHPDHVGGVKNIKKRTRASVIVHEQDAPLLRDADLFIKSRLKMTLSDRIAMKFEKGPLRVNYDGLEPDRIITDGDLVRFGNHELRTIHTGGHSAGHCVFYDANRKTLFCGDEINNFPHNSRKFYVDLSGSLVSKRAALEKMGDMDIDFLLPTHDIPHLFDDVNVQIEETVEGVIAFQNCLLEHLKIRGEADIDQLVFDITKSNSVPYPKEMKPLLPTTVLVGLRSLEKAGLVYEEESIWTVKSH